MNTVTLGGDRIGSGNKQQVGLHEYEMTSFNLEQDFKSSMAPGVLYPFIKMVGTNHGTFDIDLDSFVRTLPTVGPLFGSFKLQLDIYNIPIRLYQGILHNNPINIGLKMNQVYLPKLNIGTVDGATAATVKGSNFYNRQVNETALLKYLGLSGIGTSSSYNSNNRVIYRKINAIPALAYYDIFKCYYANKQEEKAYVIVPGSVGKEETGVTKAVAMLGTTEIPMGITEAEAADLVSFTTNEAAAITLKFYGKNLNPRNIDIYEIDGAEVNSSGTIADLVNDEIVTIVENTEEYIEIRLYINQWVDPTDRQGTLKLYYEQENNTPAEYSADIKLQAFDLKNIDDMRNELLSANTLGQEFIIQKNEDSYYPYKALVDRTEQDITHNAFTMNGLVVKTYQSDLFNNWLDTEWIDGESGISAITAVGVSDGSFTIDSLNFAEKLYNLLNRIAVSGGTYEDWQEAVYGKGAIRKAETPMYVGGMAAEIMFEEVISTSETNVENDFQPLGSLGGKGTQVGKRGGQHIHIKCDEPSYIMGIVSITPRIAYSQGNDWDLTELDTLDDLHKPEMDGIGFQDLLVEQMAWWNTQLRWISPGNVEIYKRESAGKQTAWINYQTAVDKIFGDFAKQDGYAFMVLNRNYEADPATVGKVKDITTYIDPSKYNYAFAVKDLAAQNFWVQIHSNVIARRKMGAQQIPNL